MTWLEAVEVADMEPAEVVELFGADSEAPERKARYGGGGGVNLSRSLDMSRSRSHWLHHMWRLLRDF